MPQMTHVIAYGNTDTHHGIDLVRLAFDLSQCQQATIASIDMYESPDTEPTEIQSLSYVEIDEVLEYYVPNCCVLLLFSESPVTDCIDSIVDASKLQCDGPLERIQLCELSFRIGPHFLHIRQIDGEGTVIECNYSVDISGYGAPLDSVAFELAVRQIYKNATLSRLVSPLTDDFRLVVYYEV